MQITCKKETNLHGYLNNGKQISYSVFSVQINIERNSQRFMLLSCLFAICHTHQVYMIFLLPLFCLLQITFQNHAPSEHTDFVFVLGLHTMVPRNIFWQFSGITSSSAWRQNMVLGIQSGCLSDL